MMTMTMMMTMMTMTSQRGAQRGEKQFGRRKAPKRKKELISISENVTSKVGVLQSFSPSENRLNWLLIAVPITIYFSFTHNTSMSFVSSMIAIMPLALLMGHATEEIALRTSESLGGLLNATFGNAVEIIIASLAIYTAATQTDQAETMITVVQASLVGSILGNLLLVLGLSLLWAESTIEDRVSTSQLKARVAPYS